MSDSDPESLEDFNEYKKYLDQWSYLLKLDFDASCGELQDGAFQAPNSADAFDDVDTEEGNTPESLLGVGFLDSQDWVLHLNKKPSQEIRKKAQVVVSVTHPHRDCLFKAKVAKVLLSGSVLKLDLWDGFVDDARSKLAQHGHPTLCRVDFPINRVGYDWQWNVLNTFCQRRSVFSELIVEVF